MNGWVLGGIGGLVLVAAGYFVGLGNVAKVVRTVLGVVADWAADAREWLRRPGNKVRGLCAVLAFGFLAAGLQSWQRGNTIIQQRADYVRLQEVMDWEKSKLAAEADALMGHIAERDVTIAKFVELADAQMALLQVAAAQAEAAQAEAKAAKQVAEDAERRYQDAFANRPPECEAALQVMAKACPTLKGY